MNTVETTDPSIPPATDLIGIFNLAVARPLETEADWIAAAAPISYEYGEIRELFEFVEDDDLQLAHELNLCGICNGNHYAVAEREQIRKEEMHEFEAVWDPTIRL